MPPATIYVYLQLESSRSSLHAGVLTNLLFTSLSPWDKNNLTQIHNAGNRYIGIKFQLLGNAASHNAQKRPHTFSVITAIPCFGTALTLLQLFPHLFFTVAPEGGRADIPNVILRMMRSILTLLSDLLQFRSKHQSRKLATEVSGLPVLSSPAELHYGIWLPHAVLFICLCAYKLPEDLVNIQILIQYVWGGTWYSVFLTNSLGRLMPLVRSPVWVVRGPRAGTMLTYLYISTAWHMLGAL